MKSLVCVIRVKAMNDFSCVNFRRFKDQFKS